MSTLLLLLLFFFTLFWPFRGLDFGVNLKDWARFDIAYREGRQVTLVGRTYDFGKYQGEPLAVSVNRACAGDSTPSVDVSAAYTAFSTDQGGVADPVAGGYAYYAPLVWATYGTPPDDLSTILHIQNVGVKCTSVEIWFQQQDNCLRYTVADITKLAPEKLISLTPTRWSGRIGRARSGSQGHSRWES